MKIRRYRQGDSEKLWELVFNTVHLINVLDYSHDQVNAWAPKDIDMDWWKKELSDKSPFILCNDERIYGYADIQKNGHINHFFVAHDCQRQGKGTILINTLIDHALEMGLKKLSVESSLTAKSFFEHHGFTVVKEEHDAYLRGQKFLIFNMRKEL
ncbi:GNAT family N-acetyltransferase [Klebsiella pneumoniae]|uniref:GNAT family N-acetyltransferase n=1 Tax=Klebsiella pneumoniae TaxID=573 RepID=UPI003F574A03